MTLGKPGLPGDEPGWLDQPTDIAVAPNGDIFISDGHGGQSNDRIAKFSKDGKFIKRRGASTARGKGSSTPRTESRSIPPAASMSPTERITANSGRSRRDRWELSLLASLRAAPIGVGWICLGEIFAWLPSASKLTGKSYAFGVADQQRGAEGTEMGAQLRPPARKQSGSLRISAIVSAIQIPLIASRIVIRRPSTLIFMRWR
jgi:hypothetical protein